MSKLTKAVAWTALALWALAGVHCKLEALPAFGFLKSCCFVDSAPASSKDCESDGCGTIEKGNYRAEEQIAPIPQSLLSIALLSSVIEVPEPELLACSFARARPPAELPNVWQFSYRTALPPRAPTIAS